MRQVGVLAAAGIVALEEQYPLLGQDHAHAQTLGKALGGMGLLVDPVETNLVYFRIDPETSESRFNGLSSTELVTAARAKGVQFLEIGGGRMRIVTHHQVSGEGVERAIEVIQQILDNPDEAQAAAVAPAKAVSYAGGDR